MDSIFARHKLTSLLNEIIIVVFFIPNYCGLRLVYSVKQSLFGEDKHTGRMSSDLLLGCVGKPSCGKSSFLNAATDANAKVGELPTTWKIIVRRLVGSNCILNNFAKLRKLPLHHDRYEPATHLSFGLETNFAALEPNRGVTFLQVCNKY